MDDGTTVFVDGGIPGEKAVVRLNYSKRKSWFASVVSLTEASTHRVIPPCPYVSDCGGCQLQHVAYAHQLELKQRIVEDALRRQQVVLPANLQIHGMSDPWRYRWRG